MSKKVKNVLGLKISGPTLYFDSDGKSKIDSGAIGWAVIQEVEKTVANQNIKSDFQKKENITEQQVITMSREKIGQYLKSIREEKGLTYYAVGKNSQLSIEQIQNIESGEKAYTIDSFLRICRALDCYLFLENRDGNHLDEKDIMKKAKK